jgi:CBS domain containing-hemolysin-like protein/mannitol/fructose-specific phosphotransferase system IIA component (Ntr-type)
VAWAMLSSCAPRVAFTVSRMLILHLAVLALLLLMNGFFALAELAMIRARPSRVAELVRAGDRRAEILAGIQGSMEEYLSVVQVGITCAGLGLGIVLDQGLLVPIQSLIPGDGLPSRIAGAVLAFSLGAFLTIIIGELVPKAMAIRDTEGFALRCARPLRFFHLLFWLPLKALAWASAVILRLLGYGAAGPAERHSEDELRIILGESQEGGVMSFRRLLMIENVFDLGSLAVRDAMRVRDAARVLRVGDGLEAVIDAIRGHGFSRYPLLDPLAGPDAMPVGVVHAKDVLRQLPRSGSGEGLDLRTIARPYVTFRPDMPLEAALAEFQRAHRTLGMVCDAQGRWVGFLSLEDVVEDVVGQIHDEFEREPMLSLAETLPRGRVLLGIEAADLEGAIRRMLGCISPAALPAAMPHERLERSLLERERSLSSYVGHGIAIPHARIVGLDLPIVAFARIQGAVQVRGRQDKARMAFLLLTPAADPRMHARLLSRIASLVESEYVMERLMDAEEPGQIIEAIAAAERVASR